MGRCAMIGIPLAAAACAVIATTCGGDDFDAGDGGTDTGTDTDTGIVDIDSDADTDTDEPDGGDTDPSEAGPGEPCWKDSFGPSHPNSGLPDCIAGYVCIGDDTGAWCTETCDATGDIDSSDGPFGGWCCAEFSNPCDPVRFWMPAQLSALCVPREAGSAEVCAQDATWPSSDVRCAPVCDDTTDTLVSETVCQASSETEFFCTFPCVDFTDCQVLDGVPITGFAGGCCEVWGVTNMCTPAALCL
jgi:hypothetical protein